jgi:Flp pilus assembly protein TadD
VRARTLARLGRAEEAQAAVAETLSRTLSNARLERLADDLAAGRRPEPLVGDAGEGIAEALYGVARFMVRRNRLVGLAHARLATHLRPGLVQAHILIGSELRRAEQPMLAVAAYEAVPDSAPEALDARIGAAEARESAGMLDEAVAELRGVVARWPDSVDAHTALGDMLRRNERFAEAATAYDGAIALIGEPEQRHWPLFYTRGICHERSDQWPLAEADFQKALELEPEQPQVLNYLGYSWVEMRTNLEEAEAMIRRAVEQRPDDGYIVDSLGWVLFRLGEFEGAVKHLERAVELRPVDPVINDHFGDALWMVGRRTEAEFQWKRALSFDPEPEEAERIRDKLERGLDAVIADEAAAGEPAIIGRGGEAGADANDDG